MRAFSVFGCLPNFYQTEPGRARACVGADTAAPARLPYEQPRASARTISYPLTNGDPRPGAIMASG